MPIYSPTGFLDITNATLRTSNVEAENLLMTGGNIYVTSELETDATVLNLENVTRKGNVSSNTIEITNATTGIVATGNVQASKFIGSGEYLTGIPPSAITGTLSQWSDGTNGDVYIAGGVGIANAHTLTSNTLQVGGNLYVRDTGSNVLTVDGNVVANYFEGDGSKLSGIVTDLQGVTDNGNTTTNVVQFSNVTTGLVTTANIEIGGDLKIDGLTAGTVPYVGTDKFLKDSFITTTGDTTVITSNLDVTGNIFMRGDKFIVHSESKLINDAIVGIANNNTVSTTDKGIIMQNTAGNVAIIHHGTGDGFADQLTFGYTDDPLDTVTVTNDLTKELTVNVLGNVITQNNLSVGGTLSINNITAAAQHSLQAVTNVGNVTSNTVQFSNAITSLVASSNIVVTGNVSAGHDTNTTSYFGRAAVGYMGQDDQASFAHVDHNDPARYAIKQTAAGPTYINTPAAGHIRFTVNDGNAGAEKMRITSAGKVGVGVTSPDATLHVAGNAYVSSNLTVSGNVEVGTANLFVDTTTGNVGIGTDDPASKLHVMGDITGRSISKTRTITKGTSLSNEVDTFTLEVDENRIVLNNDQGSAASSREYTANFNSGVPTAIGTVIDLEINSSRHNSSANGINHRSEIQFNGVTVLGTGNNYLAANGGSDSYQRNLKRTIILSSSGWVDYSLYPKISIPVDDDAIIFSTTNNNAQNSVGSDNQLTETMRVVGGTYPRVEIGNVTIQTFSGSDTKGNLGQKYLTALGPGSGIIYMHADYNGYDRTGTQVITYAIGKNVSGGNAIISRTTQNSHYSSTTNFNPYIHLYAGSGNSVTLYFYGSSGNRSNSGTVNWKVSVNRLV